MVVPIVEDSNIETWLLVRRSFPMAFDIDIEM